MVVMTRLRRFLRRMVLIVLATLAGLAFGTLITALTFENQFQQRDTARNFLLLALFLGGLYLVKTQWSAKGIPQQKS